MLDRKLLQSVAENRSNVWIVCRLEHEAEELCKELDRLGYMWNGGASLAERTCFRSYSDGIGYHLHSDYKVTRTGISVIGTIKNEIFPFVEEDEEAEFETGELLRWISQYQ